MNIRASHDIFASTVYLSNCGCNGCCIFLFRLLSLRSVGTTIRSVYSLPLTSFDRLCTKDRHKRPAQKTAQESDTRVRHKSPAQEPGTRIRHKSPTQEFGTRVRHKSPTQEFGTRVRHKSPGGGLQKRCHFL